MSVTLTIDEALLREAERATNIHDWHALVRAGLEDLAANASSAGPEPHEHRTVDGHIASAWTDEVFDQVLAAAAALPDLSDEEFDQFEKEMNRPLPPPWSASECD